MAQFVNPLLDAEETSPGRAFAPAGPEPETLFGEVLARRAGGSGVFGDIAVPPMPHRSPGLERGSTGLGGAGVDGFITGLATNPLFVAGVEGLRRNNPLETLQTGMAAQMQQESVARATALHRQEAQELQILGTELSKIAAATGNRKLKHLLAQGPEAYGEAIKVVNFMGAEQDGALAAEQETELFAEDLVTRRPFERFEFIMDRLGRINRIGIRDGGATAINLGPVDARQVERVLEEARPLSKVPAPTSADGESSPFADPAQETEVPAEAPSRQAQAGRDLPFSSDPFDPFSPDQHPSLDPKSLATFAGEVGPQVIGGFFDALENAADQLEQLVPLGTFDIVDGRIVHRPVDPAAERGFPEIAPAETTGGNVVRGVARFLTGFVPAFRGAQLLNLGKVAQKGAAAAGAGQKLASFARTTAEVEAAAVAAGQAVFDPHDSRLSNFVIDQFPSLQIPVIDFLAADPGDGEAEARFKLALEDLGLGVATLPFAAAIRGLKSSGLTADRFTVDIKERLAELALAPEENMARGRAAVERILAERSSVPSAMVRPDVGRITFDYGRPGDPSKAFKGGFGFSHIAAKRGSEGLDGEAFARQRIPEIIARGKLQRIYGPPNGRRAEIALGQDLVFLSLSRDSERETWVVTGFREDLPQ